LYRRYANDKTVVQASCFLCIIALAVFDKASEIVLPALIIGSFLLYLSNAFTVCRSARSVGLYSSSGDRAALVCPIGRMAELY